MASVYTEGYCKKKKKILYNTALIEGKYLKMLFGTLVIAIVSFYSSYSWFLVSIKDLFLIIG